MYKVEMFGINLFETSVLESKYEKSWDIEEEALFVIWFEI